MASEGINIVIAQSTAKNLFILSPINDLFVIKWTVFKDISGESKEAKGKQDQEKQILVMMLQFGGRNQRKR